MSKKQIEKGEQKRITIYLNKLVTDFIVLHDSIAPEERSDSITILNKFNALDAEWRRTVGVWKQNKKRIMQLDPEAFTDTIKGIIDRVNNIKKEEVCDVKNVDVNA